MAVSLAMPDVPSHVVNDLHSELVHLALTLADPDAGRELARLFKFTLCAEDVYRTAVEMRENAADAPERIDSVQRAWAFAISQWLGPNGSAQDDADRFCVRWGPGGGDPATRLRSATRAMLAARDKLRRFTILRRDGFDVLGSLSDHPDSAVYVDPPYLRETRGAGVYTHDFDDHGGGIFATEPDDHDRLARALGRFASARVVLSYYDHPRIDELYPPPRWRKITLGQADGVMNASGGTGRDRVEILLVNDGE